jgi:hypothetical protein
VEKALDEVDLDWLQLNHDAVDYHVGKVLLLYTSPYLSHHQRHLCTHAYEQKSIDVTLTHSTSGP